MPAAASAIEFTRRRVVAQLLFWGVYLDQDTAGTLELLVSELTTNAVEHSGAQRFEIGVAVREGEVFVAVADASPDLPVLRNAGGDEESGRGMFLVDLLSTAWGVAQRPVGKEVWLTLRLPARPAPVVQAPTRPDSEAIGHLRPYAHQAG